MNPAFLSSMEEKILECRLVKSGSVADIWKTTFSFGVFCIKHYKDNQAFPRKQAELNDLQMLSEVIPDFIPVVHEVLASRCDTDVLILDWVEAPRPEISGKTSTAEVLSQLHQKKADFAGLDYSNYIGELTQMNGPGPHWPTFWVEKRLSFQLNLAKQSELLEPEELRLLEKYILKVYAYLPELSKFSLLHGDLWTGNVLTNPDGKSYFIDPAVYFGDPWVDLAMCGLFGGFSRQFYEEYFELSLIDRKAKEVVPHYQLYYLLVHLNMFGRSYYPEIAGIVNRYA